MLPSAKKAAPKRAGGHFGLFGFSTVGDAAAAVSGYDPAGGFGKVWPAVSWICRVEGII